LVELKQKLAGVSVKGILAVGGGFAALGALICLALGTSNKEAVGAIISIANMVFGFYFGSEATKEGRE